MTGREDTQMLSICSGLHLGAQVELKDGEILLLGAADDADIRLLDSGVEPHHLQLQANRHRLQIKALAGGVCLDGRSLPEGKSRTVKSGARLTLASVELEYRATRADGSRITAREWPLISRIPVEWRPWLTVLASCTLLLTVVYPISARDTDEVAQTLADLSDPEFSDVIASHDPGTGSTIYTGHVRNQAHLAVLTLRARDATASSVIQVVARDQVSLALDDFLDQHYRGARLVELQAGKYRLVTAGPVSHLDAMAWDYAEIARRAKAEIAGLLELEITQDTSMLGAAVGVPLDSIAMNLVTTPAGSFLTDSGGNRYFEGATLPEGRLLDLNHCRARVVDQQELKLVDYLLARTPDDQCP